MALAIKQQRLETGTVLGGRYRILDVIGTGGVGTVVYACDEALDREAVALKVLHPHLSLDSDALARFRHEVALARQLAHPNIVRLFDFDEDREANVHFISMELIRGPNLREYLKVHKGNRLDLADIVRVLYQLSSALSFAHGKGIVHRDVKPENVLVAAEGDLKLGDFGIACSLQSTMGLTRTGEALGTAAYMSPEQFRAEAVDHRTDIYSLGILAFQAASGRMPFTAGDYYNLAQQHIGAPMPLDSLSALGVPSWLTELIGRCTSKEAAGRPQQCQEILSLLHDHAGDTVVAPRLTVSTRARRRGGRFRKRYLPKRLRHIMRVFLLVALAGWFYAATADPNGKRRLLAYLLSFEKVYQIDLSQTRRLFGLGEWSVLDKTSVLRAVALNEVRALKALINAGAELNAVDARGETALQIAARNNQVEAVYDLLTAGAALTARNPAGDTAAHIALKAGSYKTLQILLDGGLSPNHQPQLAADPNEPDGEGSNLMHLAAQMRRPEVVRKVLAAPRKAHLWRKNAAGFTALHIAVLRGDLETSRVLLEGGADPNAADSEQKTPLMTAFSLPSGADIAALLLRSGADPGFVDLTCRTAASYEQRRTSEPGLPSRRPQNVADDDASNAAQY